MSRRIIIMIICNYTIIDGEDLDIVTVDALIDYVKLADEHMDRAAELIYQLIEERYKKKISNKGLQRWIIVPADTEENSNG